MSVALPVVAVVFGSVSPPQGDVLDLKVHLGCTNEVSSFECLIANFDKRYTVTYPINVGSDGSISIGRGASCPLIITIHVEEITCESTPVENYLRVRGRCWGERIFRRVVTKTYENQKGEAIVKDLIDYYVGLSHVRDGTELIENTDTTYTLLEYENTPVFDILKYIAESADKAGVIGYDFRVDPDAKFAFFPKNSKTSPVSLSDSIEVSEYRKDIHCIRNKITVYGAAERKTPSMTVGDPDFDGWCESLANWVADVGELYLNSVNPKVGTYTIRAYTTATGNQVRFRRSFSKISCTEGYNQLSFWIFAAGGNDSAKVRVLAPDISNYFEADVGQLPTSTWMSKKYQLGRGQEYDANTNPNGVWIKTGSPKWSDICGIQFIINWTTNDWNAHVDGIHFSSGRWKSTQENSTSQNNYGLRELTETDEELHSNNECLLRAKALLAHLKDPAEYLTVRSNVIDYGITPILPGDKIHVTLPNENVDADYRIISVEYRVIAAEQTLEVTLELGRETPLLADHLYALRSKSNALARTKAGK